MGLDPSSALSFPLPRFLHFYCLLYPLCFSLVENAKGKGQFVPVTYSAGDKMVLRNGDLRPFYSTYNNSNYDGNIAIYSI